MTTIKVLFADADKHKSIVHHSYFIGEFLQAKVKNRVFVKLDNRYADYFQNIQNYFGRSLILLNSIYSIFNSGKFFAGELT